MTDGVILGISGWFPPHGELYHEEGRTIDEIAAADWMTLLAHADNIGFFTRPEPQQPAPDARIFHLTITSGDRSRELAVNDSFEAPELAMLIRLTRRAMRDRLVLTPDMLNEQQLKSIRTAVVLAMTRAQTKTPDWPADTPARVPRGKPERTHEIPWHRDQGT